MAQVLTSPAADRDLASIDIYLTEHAGIQVADDYDAKFEALFDLLSAHPQSGAPRPRLGRHVRLSIVAPHNAFKEYNAATDTVIVLRILHERRKTGRRSLGQE